jgi:hypothetical protein
MTTITIRTIGRDGIPEAARLLYTAETKYPSTRAAADGLVHLAHLAKTRSAAWGNWGDIEIDVDGGPMPEDHLLGVVCAAIEEADDIERFHECHAPCCTILVRGGTIRALNESVYAEQIGEDDHARG